MTLPAAKEPSTVTPDSKPKQTLIAGVQIRPTVLHPDERGTSCEVYNPAWNINADPLVYVYQFTIRPSKIKGWVVHYLQTDRLFLSQGHLKAVLYDDRPDSPTYKMINEICITQENRSLLLIPPYVFHAFQNIGDHDVFLINMPTVPYNHENPDKYRLPLDTDLIPYRFDSKSGW
jgi:dTDP-4-dehydrorhamnose 3,5-epimerase